MKSSIRLWTIVLAVLLAVPVLGAATASAAAPSTTSAAASVAAPVVSAPSTVRPATRCCHISVPSNYWYYPPAGTLHDYCSYSPDEYHTWGTNANFRGPCARHDMCYQYHQQSQHGCDNQLGVHLTQECTYTYSWYDPRRSGCVQMAGIYWAAVTIHTYWPW